MNNSLVALWPLVPFDVICVNSPTVFFPCDCFFFVGKKRSHMLDSLSFFI